MSSPARREFVPFIVCSSVLPSGFAWIRMPISQTTISRMFSQNPLGDLRHLRRGIGDHQGPSSTCPTPGTSCCTAKLWIERWQCSGTPEPPARRRAGSRRRRGQPVTSHGRTGGRHCLAVPRGTAAGAGSYANQLLLIAAGGTIASARAAARCGTWERKASGVISSKNLAWKLPAC